MAMASVKESSPNGVPTLPGPLKLDVKGIDCTIDNGKMETMDANSNQESSSTDVGIILTIEPYNKLPEIEEGDISETKDESDNTPKRRRTIREWLLKYFWEGQTVNKSQKRQLEKLNANLPWYKRLLITRRKIIGFLIPAIFCQLLWWPYAIYHNFWDMFHDKYFMTITMIFGSIIAGMTSEGGGAVAFPVMTLAFKIAPSVARDFSLMIQSCGMTAAAFTIHFMKIQLEKHSLLFCTLGGAIGIIFGFHVVDPNLTPAAKKIGFVSIWFSFASVLFILNRMHKRRTFSTIPKFNWWRAVVLVITGFAGGIFTSFSGSGLDVCSFSILTLLFRVSEKVATPTSVVLMAINTVVGFYWRGVMLNVIEKVVWEYLFVCIPVVVVGAPFGSVMGSHFHRLVLATLLCVIDTVALISAYVIIKPGTTLIIASVFIIAGGLVLFASVTFIGQRLLIRLENGESGDDKSKKPVRNNSTAVLVESNGINKVGFDNIAFSKEKENNSDAPQNEDFHF